MDRNLFIVIIIAIVAICLVVILFIKNQKDRKEFEQQLNRDYPHKRDDEGDIDTEDARKI